MDQSYGAHMGTAHAKHPVATGNPWMINHDDPATVPVPLPIIIRRVEGPYTEKDRKLWTFLFHTVWDELEDKLIHQMSVAEINRVFRQLGGEHDTKWIWESATRLTKTTVEWTYTWGDERYREDGIESLFGAKLSKEVQNTGILHFYFPPFVDSHLKRPETLRPSADACHDRSVRQICGDPV